MFEDSIEHGRSRWYEIVDALQLVADRQARSAQLLGTHPDGYELLGQCQASQIVHLREVRTFQPLDNRSGPLGDVLKIRPPLVVTTEQLDLLIAELGAVLPG